MIAIWFAVVSFMLIAYVVLDGRNFGAGMLHWFVAKTPQERRRRWSRQSGRFGRGMKCGLSGSAARWSPFPRLMASAFSGYYLPSC